MELLIKSRASSLRYFCDRLDLTDLSKSLLFELTYRPATVSFGRL